MSDRPHLDSIEGEFHRYKALAEGAMRQLSEPELAHRRSTADNSVVTIVWHITGNLRSRFTDFLTTDGEKPWRERETEFEVREVTRAELDERWEAGWGVLFDALAPLTDADLDRVVTIRTAELRVYEALHRSLAHATYHVGQIVHIVKTFRGEGFTYLSIPPGRSDEYSRNPAYEKPRDHAARVGALPAPPVTSPVSHPRGDPDP